MHCFVTLVLWSGLGEAQADTSLTGNLHSNGVADGLGVALLVGDLV